MRKIKLTIATLLLSFTAINVNAQEASVTNVLNLRSVRDAGEIMQEKKLVGYYVFYLKEKVDKKNNAYEIEVFDDNYNSTKKFEIIRPKNSILIQMVYNGEAFMLHFFDSKIGYEFATFDRSGKMTGSHKVDKKEISKYDLAAIQQNLSTQSETISIFPNGTKGFVRTTLMDNKKPGYEVAAYDNNAKKIWSYKSKVDSPIMEMCTINEINSGILSATVMKKKNALTMKDAQMFCLLLNAETGKLISELELGNEAEGYRSVLKSAVNPEDGSIFLLGEFYKPNDDIFKDKSLGLYLQELDLSGSEKSMKQYKWKGDIDKFKLALDPDDKKGDKPFYAYFHDVILAKNGHTFVIGEQFKKQISAGGLAVNALNGGGGASAMEIRVGNMIVLEFDAKKSLVNFETIEKKPTSVLLPQGMGMYGSVLIGHYIKVTGGFDYSFTSKNKEDDHYEVVYMDADRKEEKGSKGKADIMIGVISIKNGKQSESRVPINCDSKTWWVQPAKPGYISVSEYLRKEKKIQMRLEQLTY